jgi:hypothetical protein
MAGLRSSVGLPALYKPEAELVRGMHTCLCCLLCMLANAIFYPLKLRSGSVALPLIPLYPLLKVSLSLASVSLSVILSSGAFFCFTSSLGHNHHGFSVVGEFHYCYRPFFTSYYLTLNICETCHFFYMSSRQQLLYLSQPVYTRILHIHFKIKAIYSLISL